MIDMRQSKDALCVLLGMPAVDLEKLLGKGPIPMSPPEVAIGIPADLLRRRPDIRQAERLAAAQGEQIGIAEAEPLSRLHINGTLGYQAQNFPDLFRSAAFNGSVGPSFQWNLLNYGRIINNVRFQDAKFQELVVTYQQTVLQASREVEDGLVTFLQMQQRAKYMREAVEDQAKATKIARDRYLTGIGGETSFTTYTLYEQNLLTAQDVLGAGGGPDRPRTDCHVSGAWGRLGNPALRRPGRGGDAGRRPRGYCPQGRSPRPLPAPPGHAKEPIPPPLAPTLPISEEVPWPAGRP